MQFAKPDQFSVIRATKHSLQGIKALWRNEKAFRVELCCTIVLLPFIFLLHSPGGLKLAMILMLLLLMLIEALNSAIEAVVDRISLDVHEQSRLAKDMGSAAVGIAIVMNFIVWLYAIFIEIF